MKLYRIYAGTTVLAILISTPLLRAQQVPQQGVEVLARGPVHEAYAAPAETQPQATPIIPKEPPPPIDELPPDQRPEGESVQWIPGYWAFDEEREDYIWVSGFWRVPPPNRVWVPGSWRRMEGGYQWVGGFWNRAAAEQQQQADIQYLPEPPQPVEVAASVPPPSDNHIYVPGCWVYNDARYRWRAGYYLENKPGWLWVAPHYRWTPCGYVFIDGYWDFTLEDRGILFAPVYVAPVVYAQPAFVYTPTYVVQERGLFGAFFVRRGFGAYYFGDYFGARYTSRGYFSFGLSLTSGEAVNNYHYHDPIYSYYHLNYRQDPFWNGGINTLYTDRYRGRIAAPPRTLVQQNVVVNNIQQNNTVINNITNVNNVTMVNTLGQGRANRSQLQQVDPAFRQAQVQKSAQMQTAALNRGQQEAQMFATRGAPRDRNDEPRRLQLDTRPQLAAAAAANPAGPNPGGPRNAGALKAERMRVDSTVRELPKAVRPNAANLGNPAAAAPVPPNGNGGRPERGEMRPNRQPDPATPNAPGNPPTRPTKPNRGGEPEVKPAPGVPAPPRNVGNGGSPQPEPKGNPNPPPAEPRRPMKPNMPQPATPPVPPMPQPAPMGNPNPAEPRRPMKPNVPQPAAPPVPQPEPKGNPNPPPAEPRRPMKPNMPPPAAPPVPPPAPMVNPNPPPVEPRRPMKPNMPQPQPAAPPVNVPQPNVPPRVKPQIPAPVAPPIPQPQPAAPRIRPQLPPPVAPPQAAPPRPQKPNVPAPQPPPPQPRANFQPPVPQPQAAPPRPAPAPRPSIKPMAPAPMPPVAAPPQPNIKPVPMPRAQPPAAAPTRGGARPMKPGQP